MSCACSVADSDQLVGDPSRRITVPLPKNLNELRSHAHQHFRNGRGLFHHGVKGIKHDDHVKDMGHGDVIVVLGERDEPREAPPISTSASHYIKHPIEGQRQPCRRDPGPREHVKFEGQTSYAGDFVNHPIEPRVPVRPLTSLLKTSGDGPLGKSTYSQHYPWHQAQKQTAIPKSSMYKPNAPFEGKTSYSNDFIKHPIAPRTPTREQARPTYGAFEGKTTYENDFPIHPPARSQPCSAQKGTLRPTSGPFKGISEHAQEYVKHEIERPHMVHLEPEMRQNRTKTRAASAPRTRPQ